MELRTQEEYDAARQLAQENTYTFWLGANDIQTEGNWIWDSNGEEVERNDFWRSGKPTDLNFFNCLGIDHVGLLDFQCPSDLRFVCEYI